MTANLTELCESLRTLQRNRVVAIKSRIMVNNRTLSVLAVSMGYRASMTKEEREVFFDQAQDIIDGVSAGQIEHPLKPVILASENASAAYKTYQKDIESDMMEIAKLLPPYDWVKKPEQKGFGPLSMVTVVGEVGNLSILTNPSKLWRFMGCAPWTYEGKTLMGSTWKSGKFGKLPAEEWERFKYSPRRRAISYVIGENIVKQNGEGPYRKLYDEVKVKAAETHPDWPKIRVHRHAMLLATKRLLRELWLEWHGRPAGGWMQRQLETAGQES